MTRNTLEEKEGKIHLLYESNDPSYKKMFRSLIWSYYKVEGRNFPWRTRVTPYKVLVSEFMLQQTQTTRVVDYFNRFIKKAPTIKGLAECTQGDVIRLWSGLGYNRRALHLHACAKAVMSEHKGKIPRELNELLALPGIGPSTANAIRAFAHELPSVIVETNTRTVIKKIFFPEKLVVEDEHIAEVLRAVMPKYHIKDWYYALMDYGVHLKAHGYKLNKYFKAYTPQTKFKGSQREIRGKILKSIIVKPMSKSQLANLLSKELQSEKSSVVFIIDALIKEGFIKNGRVLKIKS